MGATWGNLTNISASKVFGAPLDAHLQSLTAVHGCTQHTTGIRSDDTRTKPENSEQCSEGAETVLSISSAAEHISEHGSF